MRIVPTIIAVVLAIAAVLAMRHFVARNAGGPRVTSGPQQLLSAEDLPIDQVDRITLVRAGSPRMVFERHATNWSQIEPFWHPMDAYSIRQVAALARQLEVVDRLDSDTLTGERSVQALQLSPPVAEVTYQWPGGSLTLELGRRSVAGRAYVRRKGDDAVCIVNQKLHERAIDMSPIEWRDRQIFQQAGIESSRIGWQQGDVSMTIERDGRTWRMVAPTPTRVDPVNRDAFLQALGSAKVEDFILDVASDRDLANFGLTRPVGVLTVESPAARAAQRAATAPASTAPGDVVTERLIVGQPVNAASRDRFAMIEGRPVIVRLSEAVLAALFRNAESLAAPTGSGVNPADVKAIVIRTASDELRLERDLEKWRAPAHGNIEINAPQAQELLDQLCTLRAPGVEFKPYPADLQVAAVTLHGFDGKALDTVRIAQEKDKPGTALENGDNVLRVFPQGLKLRLTAADYGL